MLGMPSSVSDTHNEVTQKRLFVFFLRQQRPESVSGIDDSQRLGMLVVDRYVYEAAFRHHRQDIRQSVVRKAVSDIPSHQFRRRVPTADPLAMTDPLDYVRFCDDANHGPIGIADDDETDLRTRKKFCYVYEQGINTYSHQS